MAELKIISMDEVPVEEVEWLWYPYIPFGKLTIIHGDGGEGKTTLSQSKLFIRPQRTDWETRSNPDCSPIMRIARKSKS